MARHDANPSPRAAHLEASEVEFEKPTNITHASEEFPCTEGFSAEGL